MKDSASFVLAVLMQDGYGKLPSNEWHHDSTKHSTLLVFASSAFHKHT